MVRKLRRTLDFGGGSLMILCAFALMWGSTSTQVSTDISLKEVVSRAVDIDVSVPDPSNNGKLVIAAGPLVSSEKYEDEYLKPSELLIVRRRVEMLQWVEDLVEGKEPRYSLQWTERPVNFFNFKVPQGHENPLFKVTAREYQASQVRFGGFDGSRLLPLVKELQPLPLSPDLLKDPSLERAGSKIIVRRGEGTGSTSLGDMRIWYETLPQGDYSFLVVQSDERSLVGADPGNQLFILSGLFSSANFLEGLGGEASEVNHRPLYLGALLLFFGLISLLMPHSGRFDLTPRFNVKGRTAVLAVSAVITCATTALFFLLSMTS